MRLYEYQGKELFEEFKIPIPKSQIAKSADEVGKASLNIGYPAVIKAQVLSGGRGKAGLVKMVSNEKEATEVAQYIFSKMASNEKILVEEAVEGDQEGYIGITVDDLKGVPIMVLSACGGVDVEAIAHNGEGKIVRKYIDPEKGIYAHEILNMAKDAGYESEVAAKVANLGEKLYKLFVEYDCDTAEINPIMINSVTKQILACDAKVIIDEYSFYRQPTIAAYRKERNLNDTGIFFVDLGGNIGIISGGASGTMMLCDSIKVMGGEPANFLDGTGGNSAKSVAEKSKIVLHEAAINPRYKVLLFNFNLSASSLKEIITGVCMAVEEIPTQIPVVASIRATGAALNEMSLEEARNILRDKNIILSPTLEDAIKKAIELSKQ